MRRGYGVTHWLPGRARLGSGCTVSRLPAPPARPGRRLARARHRSVQWARRRMTASAQYHPSHRPGAAALRRTWCGSEVDEEEVAGDGRLFHLLFVPSLDPTSASFPPSDSLVLTARAARDLWINQRNHQHPTATRSELYLGLPCPRGQASFISCPHRSPFALASANRTSCHQQSLESFHLLPS
jgi:hypothetical protein